ncbi:PhzF family phenazine biosynthesis protein [Streptomyces sp. NPDC004262]
MPQTRSFMQVDVFSAQPYGGNPVAVVLDGTDLTDEEMQRLARWTNLSETTFVLPPTAAEADYRVRIYTPGGELPFAGHPTLGSARAWLEGGGTPQHADRIVQECAAGLVTVRCGDGSLSFAAPPRVREGALDDACLDRIVAAFGISRERVPAHQWVDNGPGWAVVQLATAQDVLALEPDLSLLPTAMVGAIGAHRLRSVLRRRRPPGLTRRRTRDAQRHWLHVGVPRAGARLKRRARTGDRSSDSPPARPGFPSAGGRSRVLPCRTCRRGPRRAVLDVAAEPAVGRPLAVALGPNCVRSHGVRASDRDGTARRLWVWSGLGWSTGWRIS